MAEEPRLDVRPPIVQLGQRRERDGHAAPRRRRARVGDHDVGAPRHAGRRPVALAVDAEVERRGGQPVQLAHRVGQPLASGDRVEVVAVGVVGPRALHAGAEELRLVVLHQVGAPRRRQRAHARDRLPAGGHRDVGAGEALQPVVDARLERPEPRAQVAHGALRPPAQRPPGSSIHSEQRCPRRSSARTRLAIVMCPPLPCWKNGTTSATCSARAVRPARPAARTGRRAQQRAQHPRLDVLVVDVRPAGHPLQLGLDAEPIEPQPAVVGASSCARRASR